jgi:hypothetical protein
LAGAPRGPKADFSLDIDADGLAPIPSSGLDAVVACHVIEHLANPIAALLEFERVLRYHGRLVLVVPDRNLTFDAPRQPTPLSVLLNKYHGEVREVTDAELREFCSAIYFQPPIHPPHVREWYNPRSLSPELYKLHRRRTIHVHCWSPEEFASCFAGLLCKEIVFYELVGLYLPESTDGREEFGIVLGRSDSTGRVAAARFAAAWVTAALAIPNCDQKRVARFAAALHRDLTERDLEEVIPALAVAAPEHYGSRGMFPITRPSDSTSVISKIESLDTTIFAIQPGHYSDRSSFLRIQRLVRRLQPGYTYLEIGSDIGGSLLPHLLDPSCVAAISIDPRPERQPDERGTDFYYIGNSRARMLDELGKHLSSDELGKLSTIDSDASSICRSKLDARPHLVFIDGEHTNTAAFSDFLAIFPMIANNALVTFHDANLVGDTIQIIERLLVHLGTPHSLIILPTCVAVFGFGNFISSVQTELAPHAEERTTFFTTAREERHKAVADSVIDRTDGLRGRSLTELIAWTVSIEQMLAAAETNEQVIATKLRQALDQIDDLARANTEAHRYTNALLTSTSWRLTAPLRAAVQALRKRGT